MAAAANRQTRMAPAAPGPSLARTQKDCRKEEQGKGQRRNGCGKPAKGGRWQPGGGLDLGRAKRRRRTQLDRCIKRNSIDRVGRNARVSTGVGQAGVPELDHHDARAERYPVAALQRRGGICDDHRPAVDVGLVARRKVLQVPAPVDAFQLHVAARNGWVRKNDVAPGIASNRNRFRIHADFKSRVGAADNPELDKAGNRIQWYPRGRQSPGRAGRRARERLDTKTGNRLDDIWKWDSLDQNSWTD